MKPITIITMVFSLSFIFSCDFQIKSGDDYNSQNISNSDGNDKDDHGCIASAGFTWSSIQNNCIRLFEDGVRYNPVYQTKNEMVISAFTVKGLNDGYVELFLPNQKHGILLSKINSGNYSVDKYLVTDSTISIEGKITYNIVKK